MHTFKKQKNKKFIQEVLSNYNYDSFVVISFYYKKLNFY